MFQSEEMKGNPEKVTIIDKLEKTIAQLKAIRSSALETNSKNQSSLIADIQKAYIELLSQINTENKEHTGLEQFIIRKGSTFQHLIDGIPDLIFFKDLKHRYIECNEAFCNFLKLPKEEIIGNTDNKVDTAANARHYHAHDNEVFLTGKSLLKEDAIKDSNDVDILYETLKTPIVDQYGKTIGLVGICRDVSERTKASRKIAFIEEEWRQSFNSIDDTMLIINKDFEILNINEHGEKFIKHKADDAIGKKCFELVHKMSQPGDFCALNKCMKERKSITVERYVPESDKHFAIKCSPIFNEKGEIFKFVELISDITERKKAETKLLESEEKFSNINQTSLDIIFQINKDVEFIHCSPAVEQVFGYTSEEVIGSKFLNYFPRSEYPKTLSIFKKTINDRKVEVFELEGIRKDKSRVLLEVSLTPFIQDGDVIGVQGIARDITQRKKANQEMKKQKALLDEIFKNIHEGIGIVDNKERIIFANPAYAKIFERRKEEIIGQNLLSFFDKETVNRIKKQTSMRKKGETSIYELPLITKNGNKKTIRCSISPRINSNGEYAGAFGAILDVTEKAKAEEALINERDKVQQYLNIAGVMLLVIDKDAKVSMINKRGREILGYDEKEIIGKNWFNHFIPKEEKHKLKESFNQLITEEVKYGKRTVSENVNAIINKDGERRIIHWNNTTVAGKNGEVVATLSSGTDITEQKLAEEALKDSEEVFNKITTSASDAIIVIDNKGQVIFWNNSAESVFGFSLEDIMGKEFHKVCVPEEFYDQHIKEFRKFIKTGKGNAIGKTLELIASRKSGEKFPIELSLSSVKIKNEWHAVGILRDISQRKEDEKKLKDARLQAEMANKAKSEFLANMSHEIRTPMNAILGFSEILKEQSITNEGYLEYIDGIQTSGKNLLNLINDILDLSKIEAGRLDIVYEPINPHSIIDEIRQVFSFKIKEKGLDFIIDVDPKLPKGILFDETRLRQVLFNLIGNAVKFTKEGSITIEVTSKNLNEECSHIDMIFTVKDTGIGIPKSQQKIIFEPFRQREGQSTRKYGGTGLGLTITRRLVELMNGKLRLKSEPGKGTSFTVYLPNIVVATFVDEYRQEEDIYTGKIAFEPTKLLLVEDIDSNRKVMRGYLEEYNIKIIEAENGKIALDILKDFRPDIIFMDMQMPVMDGYQATRTIKNDKKYKDIPVVAITASAMKEDVHEIKSITDSYLRKPVMKKDLVKELMKYIPYRTLKEVGEQESNRIKSSEGNNSPSYHVPEALRDILLKKYVPVWEEFNKKVNINRLKDFVRQLEEEAIKHNANDLETYCRQLKQYASTFSIKNINEHIKLFPNFTEINTK